MLNKLKSYYEYNKEQIEYVISKLNVAILILYGLFVFEAFLRSTTFEINWHPYYHFSLKIILIIFVFEKSLLNLINNILVYFVLGVCTVGFLLAYLQGNHGILLELILFTVALKDIDYNKLITIFTTFIGISLLIIILGSLTGVLNNLIYISEQRTKRISFGIHHPTNFASYVLYFFFAWTFLRKNKIGYIEICLMYIFSYYIYFFCDARTNTICLISFASFLLIYKIICNHFRKKSKNNIDIPKWLSFILALAVPLCALVSIIVSYIYSPNNSLLAKINDLLSNRLHFGHKTFNTFDIKLFGQHIKMNGDGGFSSPWYNYNSFGKSGYNFIDSSYLSILFRYGLFVFICVIVLFTMTSFVARKQHDYITLIIIAIIAVHCIMEHHLLDFNYNPFMFLLVSSYYCKHINKNKTSKSNVTTSKNSIQKEVQV